MLNQSSSPENLTKTISKKDVKFWSLWTKKSEVRNRVSIISNSIQSSTYQIAGIIEKSHKLNKTYHPICVEDHLSFKLADRFLRRIYKVVQSDRNKIIREIRALLNDGSNLKILKYDIIKFFESIEFSRIIDKVESDMILAGHHIKTLKSLNLSLREQGVNGLPRGIGLSTTLSELYLEPLDLILRKSPHVIYYTRYVDDILIITDSPSEGAVVDLIHSSLSERNLSLNKSIEKNINCYCDGANFNYLGYNFKATHKKSKPPQVDISIASSKVKKIKTRIVKSFLEFKKTNSFEDLRDRLRYLAYSKAVKKSENGNILGGILYSYQYISNLEKVKVFDGFLNHLLSRDSRFKSCFSDDQLAILQRISFYQATKDRLIVSYSGKKVKRLKKAWSND